jgi:hypothetical protein
MKTYRLITLLAAVLITVFFARIFTDERIGDSPDQVQAAAVEAP